jgi:POT family proton-dependent oligopeptide transporter
VNLAAAEQTDRMGGPVEVPGGRVHSLHPLFIVLLAPLFSVAWSRLGERGLNPATPKKMVLGLVLTGIGFLAMVAAALESHGDAKASMWWLVIAYFFHTTGELCISPVGLSMVTKLAPLRLASLMMGVWFLINFVANWLAGIIGSYAEALGEVSIFGGLAATLFAFAVVLWTLSGMLVRWMHGAEETSR